MRVVKKGDPRTVRVQSTTTTQANQKSKKGKCPAGGTFGKDLDKFEGECEDCPLWEECEEANGD